MTEMRSGVVGDETFFDLLDQTVMNEVRVTPGSDLDVDGSEWGRVPCRLTNYALVKHVERFKDFETLPDVRAALARTMVQAARRRKDQILIDHILSATLNPSVAPYNGRQGTLGNDSRKTFQVGATNTEGKMGVQTLVDMDEYLNDENVPGDQRYIVMSAKAKAELLLDEKYSNSDYADSKVLVNGNIVGFMGFQFITIGKRREGGLIKPTAAGFNNKPVAIFWQRSAVGTAVSLSPNMEMWYDPMKNTHFVKTTMRCGICTREGIGTGKIEFHNG